MTILSIAGRFTVRPATRVFNQSSPWSRQTPWLATTSLQRRCFQNGELVNTSIRSSDVWREFRGTYKVPPPTLPLDRKIPLRFMGQEVTAVGHLKRIINMSRELAFVHLIKGAGPEQIQICVQNVKLIAELRNMPLESAISVTGGLRMKRAKKDTPEYSVENLENAPIDQLEIMAEEITCLNSYGKEIPSGVKHVYPPEARHLQIRFDEKLRDSLIFRSKVMRLARRELVDFHEIETPILFKSTPEGAREFLVPTRRAGFTYALPQSPQQYKQMLMASGINKYVQFARCFRDEDLRADRQPEFTQIDLEMAWTNGEGVMQRVEKFIKALYGKFSSPQAANIYVPPLSDKPFLRMTYEEAMSAHGSDKPDLRIPGSIHRVDHIVPEDLRKMVTNLEDPIIEAWKITLNKNSRHIKKFLTKFFASTEGEIFQKNADGAPGISIHDVTRPPLEGLQAFGFEGADAIKKLYETASLKSSAHTVDTPFGEGDLIFLQARPNLPHTGGSTSLGNLRRAIYKAAVADELVAADPNHHYLWMTDFPMFTLENGVDPGQGGTAGFSATHHPFTAPKTAADLDLMLTNPLKAKADHYDIVVNGVELGGGSRRIHSRGVQEYVMRDVLKMSPARIQDFEHLLKALEAGCPPHAGLAIGFDRLMAVLCNTESVRDVIAFPKNSKGDDVTVGSPRKVAPEELGRYGLEVIPGVRAKVKVDEIKGVEVEVVKSAEEIENIRMKEEITRRKDSESFKRREMKRRKKENMSEKRAARKEMRATRVKVAENLPEGTDANQGGV